MTWNPFSKRSNDEEAQQPIETTQEPEGKGRPTPRRKQSEARNLRPLVPKDRHAQSKDAKAKLRARENAEYEAMRSGDTAHMPKAERLPWRVYIRDYVDARFNLGEFFMPVVFVILIISMFVSMKWPWLSIPIMIVMYVYLLVAIVDVVIMWRTLKKKLNERFGERATARGSRSASYAWSRAIQLRRWRLPKPRYPKRGHWPK
ncbi:MAG: DUF3043 domain-containing protein [Bifidobacterium sp.]|jgi:hypothetical protein|nr:DUF3043 domain-containing protein [Bifidobacterium sp.]